MQRAQQPFTEVTMRRTETFAGAVITLALASQPAIAAGLEIRLSQGDQIHAREARAVGRGLEGSSSYFDFMIHNLAVVNTGTLAVDIEGVWIDSMKGDIFISRTALQAAD